MPGSSPSVAADIYGNVLVAYQSEGPIGEIGFLEETRSYCGGQKICAHGS